MFKFVIPNVMNISDQTTLACTGFRTSPSCSYFFLILLCSLFCMRLLALRHVSYLNLCTFSLSLVFLIENIIIFFFYHHTRSPTETWESILTVWDVNIRSAVSNHTELQYRAVQPRPITPKVNDNIKPHMQELVSKPIFHKHSFSETCYQIWKTWCYEPAQTRLSRYRTWQDYLYS